VEGLCERKDTESAWEVKGGRRGASGAGVRGLPFRACVPRKVKGWWERCWYVKSRSGSDR
jgi:hypothetical protein